jgi:hypothetical protein
MKKYILILTLLILGDNVLGQTEKEFAKSRPETLEEAIYQLDKIFNVSIKASIRNISENEFVKQYSNLVGKYIARKWLNDKYFWEFVVKKSVLKQNLQSNEVYFEPDMIDVVLRSYYRHLNNSDILLENQTDSILREYENGKRIPMVICVNLVAVDFPLISDKGLRHTNILFHNFKILKPLLVVNDVVVRDSVAINCFRNNFDKRKIKSIKKLSELQAIQKGIKNIPKDGVLLVYLREKYVLDLCK